MKRSLSRCSGSSPRLTAAGSAALVLASRRGYI